MPSGPPKPSVAAMSIQTSAGRRATTGVPENNRLRRLGVTCLIGGVVGAASVVPMLAVPPMVTPDRFSFPFDPGWHIAVEVFFAVQHLALLAGLVGLAAHVRAYGSRSVRAGLGLAIAGVLTLVVCELLAATAAWEAVDSMWAGIVGAAYGVAMLLMGIGLIVAGVSIARQRLLSGWGRWITLATGGYVFVILFPAVFGPNVAGRLAIGAWMLLWAALGWAVVRAASGDSAHRTRVHRDRP